MSVFARYIFLCLIAACLSAPSLAHAQSHYINADDQPAEADTGDEDAAPSHNVVVTSIQKCYAQLSHEDMLDIETNYVKPYEECKKRLALKLKKKNQLKAGQQKEGQQAAVKKKKPAAGAIDQGADQAPHDQTDEQPQTGAEDEKPAASGGFFRVQKDPLPEGRKPPPDNTAAAEPPPAPPPPQPKITTYSFNR